MTERERAALLGSFSELCAHITSSMAEQFRAHIIMAHQMPTHVQKIQIERLRFGGKTLSSAEWEGFDRKKLNENLPSSEDLINFQTKLQSHLIAQVLSGKGIADISVGSNVEDPLLGFAKESNILPEALPLAYRDTLFVDKDSPRIMWRETWSEQGLKTASASDIFAEYRTLSQKATPLKVESILLLNL